MDLGTFFGMDYFETYRLLFCGDVGISKVGEGDVILSFLCVVGVMGLAKKQGVGHTRLLRVS